MTPENFAFWLQGFFELAGTDKLTEIQVKMVKDHLALVFQKVTPDRSKKVKKKKKKAISPLEAAARAVDFDPFTRPDVTCAPATNPEQARINLEETMKRIGRQEQLDRPYRTTCTWVGDFSRQKYC